MGKVGGDTRTSQDRGRPGSPRFRGVGALAGDPAGSRSAADTEKPDARKPVTSLSKTKANSVKAQTTTCVGLSGGGGKEGLTPD